MEPYLIPIGLMLNSLLITCNRFVRKLPDWFYLPSMILGIMLIIAGAWMQNH